MKELALSIYYDAGGFIAGVQAQSSQTFVDRRGLESLIFRSRARLEDTQRLEEQLALLAKAEAFLQTVIQPTRTPEP